MLARDASKYTIPVTVALLKEWRAEGVGLVIVQAHPAGYGQSSSLGIIGACEAAGMPWDAYIYQYMGVPDWQEGALATLDLAALQGWLPRQLWLDAEDVDTEPGWPVEWRHEALRRDLALCDAWTETMGVQRAGIYTALWYWPPKMGNSTEWADRELWDADYDQEADAAYGFVPYGGWTLERRRIKQYAGSQPDGTDLDVLSEAEAAEMEEHPDVACDTYKAALERVVNRIEIELNKKTPAGNPAALSKPIVREIASEAFAALTS